MVRVLGRANSINVQKVMWIAAEIGLDVERVDVGGAFGGNDQADYLAKNPNGRVPTIEDDGFILWESNTIVRYLAEKYGSAPWKPAKIEDTFLAHQWMDFYLTTLHPDMTVLFWTLVRTPPEKRDAAAFDKALAQAAKTWAIVDAHLADNPFMTGTAPSMGDVPLGCAAYRWHNLDLARPDLPHLKRWYESLASRLAYQENVMLPLT
ncbi:glutathione S-transferase family protein [Thalassospiraceae bacterium LMO-JJ14]|nr:glutathione S-transferase family protein [Thalassospiraceae bacterium LMO-JJ14]